MVYSHGLKKKTYVKKKNDFHILFINNRKIINKVYELLVIKVDSAFATLCGFLLTWSGKTEIIWLSKFHDP